ncbi:hypothetical protein BDZ85DRAFT_84589 [Elsinoe ampelina]|uniref:Uncharacterized protein n=1 Tax=Elsinoe ampelina TaxID=302913 RepID=A0A6A6GGG4_9PEZI|nr:hypothetical protein BDZ85DRAFT_84589 [Elsinoe ampelina]
MPDFQKEFSRPLLDTDRLAKPDYLHSEKNDCAVCKHGAEECLVERTARSERHARQDPAIHYGLIASGNTLIRSATRRDRLSGEGVLCVEMEAAGLMDIFPCIVIRGICDYCDTHKNKLWQGYAAMAAAGYARELLLEIPAPAIEALPSIAGVLQSVAKDVSQTKVLAETTADKIDDITSARQKVAMEAWLDAPDPSINFNQARKQRHIGTGNWLLQDPRYVRWSSSRDDVLWLRGTSGCGKTVLSSTIVEQQQTDPAMSSRLCYYYFSFTNKAKQDLSGLLRCLLLQMSHNSDAVRTHLQSEHKSAWEAQPSDDKLKTLVLDCVSLQGSITLILDAVDECQEQALVLNFIGHLYKINCPVKILLTAQPRPLIEFEVKTISSQEDCIKDLDKHAVNGDIHAYVQHVVRSDQELLRRLQDRPAVQAEIEQKLLAKAGGMFRWVACQIEALRLCKNLKTLRYAIDSLPSTLQETYDRSLRSVKSEDWNQVHSLLQLLLWAREPLTLAEVTDALAVDLSGEWKFDWTGLLFRPEDALELCPTLISVVGDWSGFVMHHHKVQLAHLSVREYLLASPTPQRSVCFEPDSGHYHVAALCVT